GPHDTVRGRSNRARRAIGFCPGGRVGPYHGPEPLPGAGGRSTRPRSHRTDFVDGQRGDDDFARRACIRDTTRRGKTIALLAALCFLPAATQRGDQSADDADSPADHYSQTERDRGTTREVMHGRRFARWRELITRKCDRSEPPDLFWWCRVQASLQGDSTNRATIEIERRMV